MIYNVRSNTYFLNVSAILDNFFNPATLTMRHVIELIFGLYSAIVDKAQFSNSSRSIFNIKFPHSFKMVSSIRLSIIGYLNKPKMGFNPRNLGFIFNSFKWLHDCWASSCQDLETLCSGTNLEIKSSIEKAPWVALSPARRDHRSACHLASCACFARSATRSRVVCRPFIVEHVAFVQRRFNLF